MPSIKMREFLPSGLSGGGGDSGGSGASGGGGGSASLQQVTVMSRVTNVMQPARERTQGVRNMANMAGLPVAASEDSNAFKACCPKLTFRERVQGCLSCFAIGIVISLLAFVSWWLGNTAGWAIMYTTGNIVSLCGSGCARKRALLADGRLFLPRCPLD